MKSEIHLCGYDFWRSVSSSCSSSSSFMAQQPLTVKAWMYPTSGLSVTYWFTQSWIVSPTYGSTDHLGLEPMTGMLLSRTIWQLYHEIRRLVYEY